MQFTFSVDIQVELETTIIELNRKSRQDDLIGPRVDKPKDNQDIIMWY